MSMISRRSFVRASVAAGLTGFVGATPVFGAAQTGSSGLNVGRPGVGNRTAAERKRYKDPFTGVEVTQLTDYKGHSHHFYFTNPGWYDGGRSLLFSSDRDNRTNLFGMDLASGEIEQLTDLEPVPLPRKLHFFSACTNPTRDEVYFWHDLSLMALDLETRKTRCLHQLPKGWCVSMTNCSADGRHVYFGIWEDQSDKFAVDLHRGYVGMKETFAANPLSRILQVDSEGDGIQTVHEERRWIGHVNTSPTERNLLTFCHEGPWNLVDHRIWGLDADTGRVWKIRPTEGREVVGHEYWYADGVRIGYHGRDAEGTPMIGRIRFDGTDSHETSFPGRTGHTFSKDEKLIVGDGGDVIRLWQYDGKQYAKPRALCRHGSSMHIQQAHPHPRISPDGKYIVFSSDLAGYCNVYKVALVDPDGLPLADDN